MWSCINSWQVKKTASRASSRVMCRTAGICLGWQLQPTAWEIHWTLRTAVYWDTDNRIVYFAPYNYINTPPPTNLTVFILIYILIHNRSNMHQIWNNCKKATPHFSKCNCLSFEVFYEILAWWWPFRVETCSCKLTKIKLC